MTSRVPPTHDPVRVAVIGAGYMGSGLVNALQRARGTTVAAVYDADLERAATTVDSYAPAARALDDLPLACAADDVDVVVDGTPDPAIGAECAERTFDARKHLVSINIECDVTLGPALARRAADAGVVYTVISGDEPGELKALFDHYDQLGFRVVALGKGKNNPLNRCATPDTVRDSLPDNGITAEQVASFVDGSKTMFEMGCTANAVGFSIDTEGMHGPESAIAELAGTFRRQSEGGILRHEGVVDYVTGKELSGGVWIVVHTDDSRTRSDLAYLKIGAGPYYAFYQRYHNWFLDAPLSVLRAARDRQPTIAPRETPTCQVVAVAKRDLPAGHILDGIGGFDAYGLLVKAADASRAQLLPSGLAPGATLLLPVARDQKLAFPHVEIPPTRAFELWRSCPPFAPVDHPDLSL